MLCVWGMIHVCVCKGSVVWCARGLVCVEGVIDAMYVEGKLCI